MAEETEKPIEIIQLPIPDLSEINCPHCKSRKIIISNSRWRKISDLGRKNIRKFVEFERIHLKCKSCDKYFPLERENILPGLSISKEVLETILMLYFDFGNSERTVASLLESLYSVKVSQESIHNWIKKFGKDYCERNSLKYKEDIEDFDGCIAIDGTFPYLNLDTEDKTRVPNTKKRGVSWLQLTQLADGTLVAIWEEEKTKRR